MTYRTLLRFSRPERLIIDIEEPGNATIRHDIRLGGIGEEGARRYIETDEGPGRAPRRFRLDHIRGTIRADGTRADIREVIVALHGPARQPTRPARRIRPNSLGEKMRNLAVGLGIGFACVGLAMIIHRISDDPTGVTDTFRIIVLAVALPIFAYGLWLMRGMFRRIHFLFRRKPPR